MNDGGLMRLILFVLLLTLFSCGHHRDVRPGVNGVHRVVVASDDKTQGSQEALRQARHYCKETDRDAAIVKEEAKYSGSMNENTYNTMKMLSRGTQHVNTGTKSRPSSLGSILNQALGDGYTVEMTFKCI